MRIVSQASAVLLPTVPPARSQLSSWREIGPSTSRLVPCAISTQRIGKETATERC